MEQVKSAPGIVLMCNQDGVMSKVLHNDLGLAETDILGKPFPLLVARSSFQKALSFLASLRTRQTVFDWEFDLPMGGKMILVHCAGVEVEDSFLIVVAQTRTAVHALYEEMMRINNEQANLLRVTMKDLFSANQPQSEPDAGLYDELSKLNNELVTLQRELVKKNAQLERLNAEVRRLALVDELTHVYNRRGFFELGRQEVARAKRFGTPLSAIMMDLDHFKWVNDTYGHVVGDEVLAEVALRCKQELREVDVFGRYGGEELVVLLPETEVEQACITAERLRRRLDRQPVSTERGSIPVTMSLGVARLEDPDVGLGGLLKAADQALYKAKASGRNRVCTVDA